MKQFNRFGIIVVGSLFMTTVCAVLIHQFGGDPTLIMISLICSFGISSGIK